ncbi:MAG: prolyl oligopeptidase family serine peptidase [Verrucomicrobia bacterium]|nr:prolyl oligopeptidase family serine peptidase [Verrucomicrobiota bacterium]
MQTACRRLLRALAASLACAVTTFGFAAETQSVATFEKIITKKVGYTYLLSLPDGYEASGTKTWPLIVFLHGSGERGSDPWKVAIHGPPKLIRGPVPAAAPAPGATPPPAETPEAKAKREASAAFLKANFIVVSPQCPAGTWWDDDGVLALVDEMAAKHRVDAQRIYLTGLSMGGFGTWSVGIKYPERFAAIAPICGGGQKVDVRRSGREKKTALTSLGVWAFHGAKDPTVALEESEIMASELKKAGVKDIQLTVYPEAKHDSWTETYNNPELYAWLLKHTR